MAKGDNKKFSDFIQALILTSCAKLKPRLLHFLRTTFYHLYNCIPTHRISHFTARPNVRNLAPINRKIVSHMGQQLKNLRNSWGLVTEELEFPQSIMIIQAQVA